MPHPGLLRRENTKLTIDINHLLLATPISKQLVAQPIHRHGAARSLPLHSGPVGLRDNSTEQCDGFRDTIWCTTTARTTKETIP